MKKTILWIVAAIVIILLAIYAYKANNPGLFGADTFVQEKDAVLLLDQKPSNSTTVTYAKLSKSGYVKIYSTKANGSKVLIGTSALLTAGEHRNIVIDNTTGTTQTGSTISANIVADNGDGVYSDDDSETLVAISDKGASATVKEDAEESTSLDDHALEHQLAEAGYTVNNEEVAEEEATSSESVNQNDNSSTTLDVGDDSMTHEEGGESIDGTNDVMVQ